MAMDAILGGKVLINGTDIWKVYGAFLVEKKRGDRNNLKAIMAPAKTKTHVAVDIREEDGEKYSSALDVRNQARDVKLYFALYADTRDEWLSRYKAFISFLKQGEDGWLDIRFPDLDMMLHVFYKESSDYEPLTYLWQAGETGQPVLRDLPGTEAGDLNDNITAFERHYDNDIRKRRHSQDTGALRRQLDAGEGTAG